MFTHLHVHTEYSLLDGLSRIGPLVRRAGELGMESLALTDHGGLYGAIDFYRQARAAGVKPIVGCEMYVAPGSRLTKTREDGSPYHLTVLAKDARGYRNLVKLVTISHLEGFYHRPRVDREVLERYHEGLVVLSGCPSGEVPQLITSGRMDEARSTAGWYRDVFGDYYLELMEHALVPDLPAVNRGLLELQRSLGLPVVATNDSHYVYQEDAPLQDILVCIQTNTNIHDERRLRMADDSYYLKSAEEMAALYPELPEAVSNTGVIAEMCNLELDFTQLHLPRFDVPNGGDADEYLARICWEGLTRRGGGGTREENERLAYELEVIKQTRFANYFLVVWDIARFAQERAILFAVRGSAAASLSLYCLGVTDVNPLQYRLVFERFLNVERKELPDIDMDFQDDRREEVINYVVSRYGHDRVAHIITFGTLGAHASIRDVGRALAMPYGDVDRVARLVPYRLHITLDEAVAESTELREVYDADAGIAKLVDTARSLEGLTRHASTHAAGVVISDQPLDEYVPLQRPIRSEDESVAMTQYAMEPVAALGLLKMDFLGLVNLTILDKARKLIAASGGVDLAKQPIPLDDRATFEMLARGETAGVFQLEGSGMTRYIKELMPSSLGDVAAMIALYRPGPMEHISTFIAAKHGKSEPQYPHDALRDILEETYGVLVYQDQVLLIARTFAGYTLGEADIVRKAMGKKIPEIMAQEKQKFIAGALRQGYTQGLAEEVFALIEPFAGYAFNKAHSVSYGLISYWTAYLKANYPPEYMVSLLNAYAGNFEKVAVSVEEARRMKIPVLQPDINHSGLEFGIETLEDGRKAIRFGLVAIKNVGSSAVGSILEARAREGAFASLEQMCRSADLSGLNRKSLESLIKVGAFDAFGPRAALLAVAERILSLAQSESSLRGSGQTSMFDLFGESVPTPLSRISLPDIDTSIQDAMAWEKELLGVDVFASSALNDRLRASDPEAIVSAAQLGPESAGKRVVLVGQVASASHRHTREQKPYTIATLSLLHGTVEVFVWEEVRRGTLSLWEQGKHVRLVGEVRERGNRVSISCVSAAEHLLQDQRRDEAAEQSRDALSGAVAPAPVGVIGPGVPASGTEASGNGPAREADARGDDGKGDGAADRDRRSRQLSLVIRESDQPSGDQHLLEEVRRLLLDHRGNDEVKLGVATEGRIVTMDWPAVRVDASPELERRLRDLLGPAGHALVQEMDP